jgi:small subunit ribosomal protein S15
MAKISNKIELKKPTWLKYTKEEVTAIILKLAKKGQTAEKIGLILRDQYGIPTVKLYELKIKEILEKEGEYQEPTNLNLKSKLDRIINHFKKNKQDKKTGRSLMITKAKLKKREEYEARKSNN